VLIRRREGCTVFDRGAFVTIRRAPIDAQQIGELRRALESVVEAYPQIVTMFVFRLSSEYPIAEHHLTDFDESAKFMRAIDEHVAAHAIVLEFGGIRGAAMRILGRTVVQLVKPRAAFAFHERVTEAATWLLPYAREIGVVDDLGAYVRSYRDADRLLESES
jgi:hypothetical protein